MGVYNLSYWMTQGRRQNVILISKNNWMEEKWVEAKFHGKHPLEEEQIKLG